MDTQIMLQSLRDPMGVPFYPLVFQGLGVLTFALHIFFVNLVVGGALVALWGHYSRQERWRKLSRSLAKATTINLSIAIVLGVAPLLFVQVIYDPLWYTSNLLSAWWAIGFLALLIIGALATYAFYLKRKQVLEKAGGYGLLAAVCFFIAAGIIHALSMQSLHPEQWLGWIIDGATVDTGGSGLHSFQVSRILHFLVPSLLNTGLFLMLYAWYFKPRKDLDDADLEQIGRLGLSLARYAVIATIVIGIWWLMELPSELNFMTDHSLLAGILLAVILTVILIVAGKDPGKYALPAVGLSVLTLLVMSISRESLRMSYLKPFGYSVYKYPMDIDWGSTLLFLVTFVLGLLVLGYLLRIAYKAGRGDFAVETVEPTEP
jgi:hypothetical protein